MLEAKADATNKVLESNENNNTNSINFIEGSPSTCGDEIIQSQETCDGDNLGGATCQSLGFEGGTLACLPNCIGYDTSNCNYCGDNFCSSQTYNLLEGDYITSLTGAGPLTGQMVSIRIDNIVAQGPTGETFTADFTLLNQQGQELTTKTAAEGEYLNHILTYDGESAIQQTILLEQITASQVTITIGENPQTCPQDCNN